MQPSNELRGLMIRYWEAFAGGDVPFVEAHPSIDSGLLGIGTDVAGVVRGCRSTPRVRPAAQGGRRRRDHSWPHPRLRGGVRRVDRRPAHLTFPGGAAFTARFTAIAHREDGDWKLVQAHTSVGVPNDQLVGQTLPT
jgi:hypothetical protein